MTPETDGFEQGAQSEVSRPAQESLGGADDQGERLVGEDVVSEAGAIELVEEELLDVFGRQAREDDRVGSAGADRGG